MPRSGGGTAWRDEDGEGAEHADGGWIRWSPIDLVEGTVGTTLENKGRQDPRVPVSIRLPEGALTPEGWSRWRL